MYDDLRAFCLFMGYTRSGHSLVGALLDAHPDAVIAHEGEIFEYDDNRGLTGRLRYARRGPLVDRLVVRSQRQARSGRRGTRLITGTSESHRVDYAVPGGSNGAFERLRVVGNKAGQESPVVWGKNPGVFDELEAVVGVPVRFLHVYRNPWDNIASSARSAGDKAAPRYFQRARIIQRFKAEAVRPVLDVRFESLVADPAAHLRSIFGFYELDAPDDLLTGCASVIDPEPNPSRHTRDWTPGEVRVVAKSMREFDWLEGYPDTPD
jgi:hypothetical protein